MVSHLMVLGTANVTLTPEVLLEGKNVAVQVGDQTSNYVTIAYAITSDLANRATKLNTARSINGTNFDGTANITIAPSLIIKGNTVASKVGNQTSTYITVPYATSSGNTTGNAATADKWKTARTLTIGATGKSVDGSANVSWSLDDIGVYSKEDSEDRYVNVTGDTMTGDLNIEGNITLTKGGTNQDRTFGFTRTVTNRNVDIGWNWAAGDGAGAFFRSADYQDGMFGFYARNSTSVEKALQGKVTGSLTWCGNEILTAGNYTSYTVTKTGGGASGTWGINISGNAATATTWQTSRTLTIGSTGKSVNGSANVSWTLDEIGVYSKTTSDSRFVNATGDTMTGTLTLKGSTSENMTFANNVHPALRFDNSDSSQNVAFIFTDYDTYRSPAGIKLIGNQGSEWFEAAGEMYASGGKKVLHAGNYTDYTVTKTGSGASGSWGISITGNAATATKWQTTRTFTIGATGKSVDGGANVTWTLAEIIGSAAKGSVAVPVYWTGSTFATVQATFGNSSSGEHNANNIKSNGMWYYSSNGPATSIGASTTDGALYSQAYSTSWAGQIAQDYRNGGLYVRGLNNGTWQSWYTVLDSRNYTTYTVKKDGTGASGTWGISISGNAATATSAGKWTTARTITIGSTGKTVDGSANVSWTLAEIGASAAGHTHDDRYYTESEADSRFVNVTGDTMTGALKRYYGAASTDPMIALSAGDFDVWLWRINNTSSASVSTSGCYGFGLKYIGTGSGNNNNLVLYSDAQAGTQVAAMTMNQDGKITLAVSPTAPGFIKSGSSASYVLTGNGGHKEWSEAYKVSTLVARNSSGQIYCSHLNTTSNDMNATTFTKVFVSNDNWIRYVSKSKFIEAITAYDTVTITKSLTVTEAWMDTGIVANTSTFSGGSGTYAIKISHANLNTPASNGYASIYSGIISIYTDATSSTTDAEEVILHRAGYSWANRIYIRTMPVASSGNCKIQIATSKTWTTASNITFTFRKLI